MKNQSLYYSSSKKADEDSINHPGIRLLRELALKSKKILDVGCGEGTHLNHLSVKQSVGVDVNRYAIDLANSQYPNQQHLLYDGSVLPFDENSFDLTYTTFVLEHTHNPQLFIDEIVRVTKESGIIFILCPNYGAPSRRSPNSSENTFRKLLTGVINDFSTYFKLRIGKLVFTKVRPKEIFRAIDDDTTVEPYIFSLEKYMESLRLEIITSTSLWELEPDSKIIRKYIFKKIGLLGIFPIKYWGPQVLIIARKNKSS